MTACIKDVDVFPVCFRLTLEQARQVLGSIEGQIIAGENLTGDKISDELYSVRDSLKYELEKVEKQLEELGG